MTRPEPLLLTTEELRVVADLIHKQEVIQIQNAQNQDPHDFKRLLKDSEEARKVLLDSLVECQKGQADVEEDPSKEAIAADIAGYVINGLNDAVQSIRNFSVRQAYIHKIKDHAAKMFEACKRLTPGNAVEIELLSRTAADFRNYMREVSRARQTPTAAAFSRMLQEEGLAFEDLVALYQRRRGFAGPFERLEPAQKVQVYDDIIRASGRGDGMATKLSRALDGLGVAVLLVTVGLIVWDVFESAHPVGTAAREVVTTAVSMAGGWLGEVVGMALASDAAVFIGVQASAEFVIMAGVVGGLVGAFIAGEAAAVVLELVLSSGGAAPLLTDGLKACVLEMPDGGAIARQLAHRRACP